MRRTTLALLALALAVTGCEDGTDSEEPLDGEQDAFIAEPGKTDSNGIIEYGFEATCVLRLVNRADVDELDDDAGLWRKAARGIIAYRAGADGALGTADDVTFKTVAALDDIPWVGYFAFQRLLAQARRAGDCPGLAEEYVPDGEDAAITSVLEAGRRFITKAYEGGDRPARRDAHPKAHGCVTANLAIDGSLLPKAQQVGLFKSPASYPAWIRFSNGSFRIQHDKEGDIRGMAIKVMGVPGEKILEGERDATTQDFLLINTPVLMVRNAIDYVEFSEKAFDGNPVTFFFSLNPLEWQIRELIITLAVLRKKIASPLQSRYWSTTPYLLGEGVAVKYSARPCDGESDKQPQDLTENYLSDVLAAQLGAGPACFELMVQQQTDPESMPVEDPTFEWDEDVSPFIPVGTLTIDQQSFRSEAQQTFCENLSFTPWHSLPEHRPIGGINRVRLRVYEGISKHRHGLNNAPRVEPTDHTVPGLDAAGE